ncbi:MAG: hypothetical protein ACT4TC_19345 [Myxococcaceae bacterium]
MRQHRTDNCRRGFARWFLLCSVVLANSAFAQSAASTAPALTNGIRVGDGRLHPYFDLELRYDSAAGFFPPPEVMTANTLSPEIIMHFRPGLRLDIPGNYVDLDVDANVDYVWYTGILSAGSNAISRLQAAASADVAFNKVGAVELQLGDHFLRSDRTSNAALGVGVISLLNEARIALPIHPGGGALTVTPGASWGVEFFEPLSGLPIAGCAAGDQTCTATSLAGMAYHNFHFDLDARWRFLPKTAIVLDTGFDIRSYRDPATNPAANLLRLQAGLAGLLTSKIAIIAKAGWGQELAGAVTGRSTPKTVIAQAEVSYLASETSIFKIGYVRSLEPVPTFGEFSDDRGYMDGQVLLGGRLTLHGYVAYDSLRFFPPRTGTGAATTRVDNTLLVDVRTDYQFTGWLIGTLGYDYSLRTSSNNTVASLNFQRHEAYLRATLTY